jgi:hypothetical protein
VLLYGFNVYILTMGPSNSVKSNSRFSVRLCLSKISKCLSAWELVFLHNSRDAHFSHDTPRIFGLDLPVACFPGAREPDRINEPRALASMPLEAGVHTDDLLAEAGAQPLSSPEDFWTIAMGSGYRGTIEQLDQETRNRVWQATLDYISKDRVQSVETNAVYAIARKP